MTIYNLDEFAKKIGVDEETLQKWDREGLLKAEKTYTDKHYEKAIEVKNNDIESKEIKTNIIIKKEETEDFVVLIQHLKTNEYIELKRHKTYKNARLYSIKKKEEYGQIGIEITIAKEV